MGEEEPSGVVSTIPEGDGSKPSQPEEKKEAPAEQKNEGNKESGGEGGGSSGGDSGSGSGSGSGGGSGGGWKDKLKGGASSVGGALSSGGGRALAAGAVVGGAAVGVAGAGLAMASGAADTAGQHIKENTFFLFILFVSLLDSFNNLSRGGEIVAINLFLLICVGSLFVMSFIMPTKMLWGVIALIITGIVMNYLDYLSYSISTLPANFFFFFIFLAVFVWAWMGVFRPEGSMISKDSLKSFAFTFTLSAFAFYAPIIRNKLLPPNAVIDGILIIAPIWLVYMLLFKPDTQLIKMLGAVYILFWVGVLLLKSGVAQAAVFGAAKAAQEGQGSVDSKGGLTALMDNLKGSITKTQREISGEDIHGEVNDETRKIFIGVELQDPSFPNKLKFDYDADKTIRIGMKVHSYGYKTPVPVTLECYGGTQSIAGGANDFIDTSRYSLGTIKPASFDKDVIIPKDVSCSYSVATSKNQLVAILASAQNFQTRSFIENYFIDKSSMDARLVKYTQDTRKPLDNAAALRSAIASIDEYQGLPTTVYSQSDNGPAKLNLATSDFPLIGIDESESGSINLLSAIENNVPVTGPVGNMKGRIERITSMKVLLPEGFTAAPEGCAGWVQTGNEISLTQEALGTMNNKVRKLKKTEQERLPDCQLMLTDRQAVLLKSDRPNPATFHAEVIYDYTVERTFTIISENPGADMNTTGSAPASTPASDNTTSTTSNATAGNATA